MTTVNIEFGEKEYPGHNEILEHKSIYVPVFIDNLIIGFLSMPEDLEGTNEKGSCILCLGPHADEFRGFKSDNIPNMKELVKKTLSNSNDKFHDLLWSDVIKNWEGRAKQIRGEIYLLQEKTFQDVKDQEPVKQIEIETKLMKSINTAIKKYSVREKEID